jgi:hypothetical protein
MLANVTVPAPAPLSLLSIAGRAGHAFTAPAMMQGFVCHARGVELVSNSHARVHARVRSKRTHDVLLRAEDGRLSIGCTCVARTYGLDFCKHAWAALLEVDRQDGLGDLRRTRGPLRVDVAPPAPDASPAKSAEPSPKKATANAAPAKREKTEKTAKATSAKAAPAKAAPSPPEPKRAAKSKPAPATRSAKRR